MEVIFHKSFEKNFKKVPPKVRKQFVGRLDLFLKNKFNKILHYHSVDKAYPLCKSINVNGDYRAIFQEGVDVVVFVAIGTHSELY